MITYKNAGVNVDAGNDLVQRIKRWAPKIGGFADGMPLPKGIKDPLLVSCADGVGTKLAIAQQLGIHHTVGQDLVAMNVNDLICSGARPLFFLDYYACGKLDVIQAEQVIQGIAKACRESQCELLGGETAEMPGFYKPGEYDLAGFSVGVVSRKNRLDPKKHIKKGDILLGLPSTGLHSNGFSLVRKLFPKSEWKSKAVALLRPTKIYVREVLSAISKLNGKGNKNIKGVIHITGGGFTDNIPRVLPHSLSAHILMDSWPIPSLFKEIQKRGRLSKGEMFRTFNMGIGMILVVGAKHLKKARALLPKSYIVGEIQKGNQDVRYV